MKSFLFFKRTFSDTNVVIPLIHEDVAASMSTLFRNFLQRSVWPAMCASRPRFCCDYITSSSNHSEPTPDSGFCIDPQTEPLRELRDRYGEGSKDEKTECEVREDEDRYDADVYDDEYEDEDEDEDECDDEDWDEDDDYNEDDEEGDGEHDQDEDDENEGGLEDGGGRNKDSTDDDIYIYGDEDGEGYEYKDEDVVMTKNI